MVSQIQVLYRTAWLLLINGLLQYLYLAFFFSEPYSFLCGHNNLEELDEVTTSYIASQLRTVTSFQAYVTNAVEETSTGRNLQRAEELKTLLEDDFRLLAYVSECQWRRTAYNEGLSCSLSMFQALADSFQPSGSTGNFVDTRKARPLQEALLKEYYEGNIDKRIQQLCGNIR